MRVVTYESERGPRAGLLRGDSVLDAWDAIGGDGYRSLNDGAKVTYEAEEGPKGPVAVDVTEVAA